MRQEDGRQVSRPIREVDVLWVNGGLSCDGESVALTGATQPSVEDLVMGAIPGLPRLKLHNPFLAYENGDEFMDSLYRAEAGELEPFILVVEGSIPNEEIKREGYCTRTAETHRSRLMHKLALHTQADLIRYALRRGIIPMENV